MQLTFLTHTWNGYRYFSHKLDGFASSKQIVRLGHVDALGSIGNSACLANSGALTIKDSRSKMLPHRTNYAAPFSAPAAVIRKAYGGPMLVHIVGYRIRPESCQPNLLSRYKHIFLICVLS